MNKHYEKEGTAKRIAVISAAFILLFLMFLYWDNQRIQVIDVSGCDTSSAEKITYGIEKYRNELGYIYIKGYAYEPGVSVDYADISLLAYDQVTKKYYRLPTENIENEKLTEHADDGFNYNYAAFESVTMRKKIKEGCRFYLLYRNNGENILIQTEQVLE